MERPRAVDELAAWELSRLIDRADDVASSLENILDNDYEDVDWPGAQRDLARYWEARRDAKERLSLFDAPTLEGIDVRGDVL